MTPTQREAALRLADELQRFDGPERESLRDEAAALLQELLAAEPVQEPVGYMPAVGLNHLRSGSGPVGVWPTQAAGYEPVYAAPQQRRPLTDEQMKEVMSAAGVRVFQPGLWDVLLAAGRAIEAAHGIKETP